MKLYTKTGDAGETSRADGQRVRKDDAAITTVGVLDEFSATIGVLSAVPATPLEVADVALLQRAQAICLYAGAVIAGAPVAGLQRHHTFSNQDVTALEKRIDTLAAAVPALTRFILPGGSPRAAAAHLARTVCRRAERQLVALALDPLPSSWSLICRYFNRLSDYLFVLARYCNQTDGQADIEWERR